MTRLAKDPKPVPNRPRRGKNDKWEEQYREVSEAQANALNTAIQNNIDRGIPWDSWSEVEQKWHAFYWTGQRCPTILPGNGLPIRPKMEKLSVRLDLEDTEQGKEISRLLEEMDEREGI